MSRMSLTSLTIRALRDLLARREVSAVEVARAHLERIEALDGSTVRSLLTTTREHAEDFGRSRALGSVRQVVVARQDHDRDAGIGQTPDAPCELALVGRRRVARPVRSAGRGRGDSRGRGLLPPARAPAPRAPLPPAPG